MPTATDAITFPCPRCQAPYAWHENYVGKLAKCPCGHVLRVPSMPKKVSRATPVPPRPMDPSQIIHPALAAASAPLPGKRSPNEVPRFDDDELDPTVEAELRAVDRYGDKDVYRPDPFRDQQLPAVLLVVGVILVIAQAVFQAGSAGAAFALLGLTIMTIINVAMMLVGAIVAARFAGIDFGPLGQALLKLSAICIGPSVLGGVVTEALGGDLAVSFIGWGVSIVCYWGLLAYLFRLDASQTMICVLAIAVVRFIAAMCVVGALAGFFMQFFASGM